MAHGLSPSEQLTYSTVRIECDLKGGGKSTGTGFFFKFLDDGQNFVPVVVTNNHVVKDAVQGRFLLHEGDNDGGPHTDSNFSVSLGNFESLWIKHPDPKVDLCILPIATLLSEAAKQNRKIFYVSLDPSLIPSEEQLAGLTAVEEVLMVGYPVGIWDKVNNMPIIRRGITATHPSKNYDGRHEFMIDAACFPGSSGSPVLLFNIGSYALKTGGIAMGSRILLLGILYAGPQYNAKGEIVVENVPTGQKLVASSSVPTNLGLCIKAAKLREFEPIIEKLIDGNA